MWETISLIAGLSILSGVVVFFVTKPRFEHEEDAARKLLQKLKELEEKKAACRAVRRPPI